MTILACQTLVTLGESWGGLMWSRRMRLGLSDTTVDIVGARAAWG